MKKGIILILAGVIVGVGGITSVVCFILLPFITAMTGAPTFLAPGEFRTELLEPGRYYLYNDYKAMFDGQVYRNPIELPDNFQVVITQPDGEPLPFTQDTSITVTKFDDQSRSVGYVDLPTASPLTVTVSGFEEKRVFAFGPGNFAQIFIKIAVTIVLFLLSGGIGALLGILGIIAITRDKQQSSILPALP